MNSVYHINKGINKPLEFRGLKAQYVAYLAGGLVLLLLLFLLLRLLGAELYSCVAFIIIAGTALFMIVFRLNHKYGRYGLMKKQARARMPRYICFRSRKLFTRLKAVQ